MNLTDKSNKTCLALANEKGNRTIISLLNEKFKQSATPSLNPDELNNLAEFYKKKSFAKSSSTKHLKAVIQENHAFDLNQKIEPIPMVVNSNIDVPKASTSKVFEFDSDNDDDIEDDKHSLSDLEDKISSKKSRFSSSPQDDTWKWIKSESRTNFELCLTGIKKKFISYLELFLIY